MGRAGRRWRRDCRLLTLRDDGHESQHVVRSMTEYERWGEMIINGKPKEKKVTTVASTSDERTVNNVMRHAYRVLSDEEKAQMQALKDKGLELHQLIESIGKSRELSLALTKTEEAVMWAVKHITR